MSAFRISLALLALSAFAALAQVDQDGQATAPPRQLGAPVSVSGQQPAATDEATRDKSETTNGPATESNPRNQPPDVSTDDLLDDVPPDERSEPGTGPSKPTTGQSEAPSGAAMPKAQDVEIGTLGKIDGPPVGLLDASNGGFSPNLWSGSSRDQIEDLLSRIPVASPDSAVRTLARRVILTKADSPPGTVHRALLTIRIEKLLSAGMIDDAATLASAAQLTDDEDFARVQANALLFAGRTNDVCGPLTGARMIEDDLFWLQLRAYCADVDGDSATAELTRSVIDAQGKSDPAFNILVRDALTGAKTLPGKIAKPTALYVFLMRKAGLAVGPELGARLGVPSSLIAMRDTGNAPQLRLAAAERLVKRGAVASGLLRAVLDAQSISAGERAQALEKAGKLPFLAAQALLRRAAQLESRPAVKAAMVHDALVLADKEGLFETAADLQADVAATIDPSVVPRDQAPLIGWALLLAGKADAAARWLGPGDAARTVLALASGRDGTAQTGLSAIATRLAADPKVPDPDREFEALILGLYDALGRTLPDGARAQATTVAATHWPGRRPGAEAMQKMVKAAAAPDHKGEAILRILDIVGPGGPGDLAPDVNMEIVRSLRDMGLGDTAKNFALHALLLYRPRAP